MAPKNRLYYLDNLKVLLIFLVIIHHVGQAYGSTGWAWFYSYPGDRVKSLRLLFRFDASFFMGLFFFISGYFFPASFDRHGARKFITDKLIRFGIPLIFAAFLIIPVLEYVKYLHYTNWIPFQDFYIRSWLGYAPDTAAPHRAFNFGHLWFVEHLLVYSILYAAIRTVLQKCAPSLSISTARDVRLYEIILYIAVLGFITHLMRTSWGFPIDRWVLFLGFIQMEPAHIPQYLSLFVLGIFAYRCSFLESLTTPRNMLWLVPSLGIYAITVVQLYTAGRVSAFFPWEYREALLCAGVCIGLLALFRSFFNRTGHIAQILAENAYGTYIVHVPVVVALQYAFDPVEAGAFTLFVIVSFLSIIGSFFASFCLRLIPGVKRVL
jgi:glucans biosynthesis protein C